MTLKEIVEQLRFCGFECVAGSIENNTAFIALCELADNMPSVLPVYQVKTFSSEEKYYEAQMLNACTAGASEYQFDRSLGLYAGKRSDISRYLANHAIGELNFVSVLSMASVITKQMADDEDAKANEIKQLKARLSELEQK